MKENKFTSLLKSGLMIKIKLILFTGVFLIVSSMILMKSLGCDSVSNEEQVLRERCLEAVEMAQLYFVRPAQSGGGERTFERLSFNPLLQTTKPDSMKWSGEWVEITLTIIDRLHFALEATSPGGITFHNPKISFNSRPEVFRGGE